MNSPKISIIVPCYNYGNFLAECLTSVLNQKYSNFECIVVDNASTDNTKEVASEFSKKDKRFSYLFCDLKGVAHARNFGIKNSTGSYILPLDADDKIGSDYISKAIQYFEQNNNVEVVYCDAELFGHSSGSWSLPPYSFKDLLIENLIFCSAIYKRTSFDRVNGYDVNMKEGLEDWEFWITLLSFGGQVYKIPEIGFYYRIRKQSRNHTMEDETQLRLRTYIYNKHKALYDQYFNVPELIYQFYKINKALNTIQHSKELKVGEKLLAPVRMFLNLFRK